MRILPRELYEAEQLLKEVGSWTESEIEELPKFYTEKARKFQRLQQQAVE